MKLLLVLLLCVFTQGLPIYRKDLRNLHKLEKNKIIARRILGDFNRISQEIYQAATLGKNETRFELQVCSHTIGAMDGECRENRNNNNGIQYGIQFEMPSNAYKHILIKKIGQTFPDSKIVQIKKPCCLYMIYW